MRVPALLLLGLVLALARPAAGLVDLPSAQGRPILRVEVHNESRVRDAEIRELFGLRAGDGYDVARAQQGLSRLAQKVGIRNVLVRGSPEGEGLALRLEVSAEPLIRTLRFRGNRAARDAELASRLQTRVDRPLAEAVLAQDLRAIREFYEGEGFPEVGVEPRVEETGGGRWLRLTLRIDEGRPLRVTRVEGDGSPALEPERLRALLGLREGSPASRRRLREGVKRVIETLHSEGYPEARMGRTAFRPEGEGVVLALPLTVGERIDVRVEDEDEWAAAPLREAVRSRLGEPLDEEWAERTAALLVEHLRAEGHRDAAVAAEVGEAYGRKRVSFRVERGPRVRVKDVTFEGNESVPAETLRGYLSLVVGGILRPPPFTEEALDRDLKVLADYYASRGYLEARLAVLDLSVSRRGEASLRIHVDEGRRYLVGEIDFPEAGPLSEAEARAVAGLRTGDPADPGEVEQGRVRLLRELQRRGYPDAAVSARSETVPEAGLVHVHFRIAGGPAVRFGRPVISGNARTQTKVVRRELTFREGETWNSEELLRSRQRLYRLGFFQRVRIEPLDDGSDGEVRDVRVEVEEQDAGSVTFGLGYGTEEGVKGFASVSHANLQGYGRSLGVRYDFDQFDRSWAVNFREPWLFNHPFDLGLSVVKSYQNREAYNLSSLAFQARLEREVTEELRASLIYTLEDNQLTDVVDQEVLGQDEISAYLLSAVGPVLVWDSRDDPFNPKKGFHHTFQAEWALEALGSEVRYERYLGSLSGFFSRGDLTLALAARGGVAGRLGQDAELPVNKRFFLGGRSTLRGFEKDDVGPRSTDGTPVGGDLMANLKAELRFPLWKTLGGALFWDAGNVWNRTAGFPSDSGLRHGTGGGLRYVTPVGPISLDVGFNPDRREGESSYAWYFTIGNVF